MNYGKRPSSVKPICELESVALFSDNFIGCIAYPSTKEFERWGDGVPMNHSVQLHLENGELVIVTDMPTKVIGWEEFMESEEVTA